MFLSWACTTGDNWSWLCQCLEFRCLNLGVYLGEVAFSNMGFYNVVEIVKLTRLRLRQLPHLLSHLAQNIIDVPRSG